MKELNNFYNQMTVPLLGLKLRAASRDVLGCELPEMRTPINWTPLLCALVRF